ncbi:hypothetical protein [Amphritea sp.]|uniref:hypothetical protein n=1 Tax=Amphritea sp. TaxID=1872502 RepID=UPI003A8E6638
MSDAKSPLFNRTYLKIIVWIVAVAIVLLTAGQNSSSDFIRINKHPDLPLYYVDHDDTTVQLSLLFRTGAAINSEQQLLQQLLLQQAEQQLAELTKQPPFNTLNAALSAGISADKLQISITLPAKQAKADAIKTMAEQLLQRLRAYHPGTDLEQRWTHLEAAQYLNLKDPENRLLSTFGNLISSPASIHPLQRFAEFFHHSVRPDAVTLTLKGPDTASLAERLSSLLRAPSSDNHSINQPLSLSRQRLSPQDNQTYRLLGLALPGRQQPQFATELLAVSTLQQLLQQQSQMNARLVWKSLDKQGFVAMILQGSKINANDDLGPLMQTLLAKLDDRLINDTRDMLQNNYQIQMEAIEPQLSLLNTIAFYQLPLDYLNNFEEKLNQVDNAEVKKQITLFLTSPGRYQLTLPAY